MNFTTPPYLTQNVSVQRVMLQVLVALLPGVAVYAWLIGPVVLVQMAIATLASLLAEAFMLRLLNKPLGLFLGDGSAIVTAWLIALAFPPLAPWWLIVVAALFAIVVAKHLYGGLGQNPFNPAMIAFAVCIVSFPALMSQWPPVDLKAGFFDQLALVFGQVPRLDAMSGATPLDALKTALKLGDGSVTVRSVMADASTFGYFAGKGWEWVGAAVAVAAPDHQLARTTRLHRRHRRAGQCALAVEPRPVCQSAVPSVHGWFNARGFLHRHRSSVRLHDGQRQADLRPFGRHAGLYHPRFRRLSGRCGVCRVAAQYLRSADRPVHATTDLRHEGQAMTHTAKPPSATKMAVRTAVILFIFVVIFTGLLSGAYLWTLPTIEAAASEEKMKLIDEVLPRRSYDNDLLKDTVHLAPTAALGHEESSTAYRARKAGKASALVLEAVAPDGYAGKIRLLDPSAHRRRRRRCAARRARDAAQGNAGAGRLHRAEKGQEQGTSVDHPV